MGEAGATASETKRHSFSVFIDGAAKLGAGGDVYEKRAAGPGHTAGNYAIILAAESGFDFAITRSGNRTSYASSFERNVGHDSYGIIFIVVRSGGGYGPLGFGLFHCIQQTIKNIFIASAIFQIVAEQLVAAECQDDKDYY